MKCYRIFETYENPFPARLGYLRIYDGPLGVNLIVTSIQSEATMFDIEDGDSQVLMMAVASVVEMGGSRYRVKEVEAPPTCPFNNLRPTCTPTKRTVTVVIKGVFDRML